MRVLLAVTAVLAACRTSFSDDDVAALCLDGNRSGSELVELDVDLAPVMIDYVGCGTVEHEVTCTVERDGDVLRFTSNSSGKTEVRSQCELAIVYANGVCEMPALEPGTYTFEYAGHAMLVELPGTTDTPCIRPNG